MVDVIDAVSPLINIAVISEGHAHMTNLTYPTQVISNTAFTIEYDVTNTATTSDTLWGGLYSAAYPSGSLITGTYWTQTIAPGITQHKIISFATGIASSILGYEIRIGHQE
jgi:hypothetical protein